MPKKPYKIKGGIHEDERGKIAFVNDFSLSEIQRMYHIHPSNANVIRAWQGHQKERKWFHCLQGKFIVKLLKINEWDCPSKNLKPQTYILNSTDSEILCIPGGYVNGFKALEENSILMVFSDMNTLSSKEDDYRFDRDYWKTNWEDGN